MNDVERETLDESDRLGKVDQQMLNTAEGMAHLPKRAQAQARRRAEQAAVLGKAEHPVRSVDIVDEKAAEVDESVPLYERNYPGNDPEEGGGDYKLQESEADQARQSLYAPETVAKPKSEIDQKQIEDTKAKLEEFFDPAKQVVAYGAKGIQHMANAARAVLKKIGIKTKVNLVDDFGIGELLRNTDELAAAGMEGAKEFAEAIRAGVASGRPGWIVHNADNPLMLFRTPVIYISNNANVDANGKSMSKAESQITVLAHELGHLVEYAYLQQVRDLANSSKDGAADAKEMLAGLQDAYAASGSTQVFAEWFANQFVAFVAQHRGLSRTFENAGHEYELEGLSDKSKKGIKEFFQGLMDRLHDMWQTLRTRYGLSESYSDFMRGVMEATGWRDTGKIPLQGEYGRRYSKVTHALMTSPYMPRRKGADKVMPYTAADAAAFAKNGAGAVLGTVMGRRRAQSLIDYVSGDGYKAVRSWGTWGHQMVTQSSDAYLRSVGLSWLADQFHTRPDVRGAKTTEPIDAEVRRRGGEWHRKLNVLLAHFAEKRWYDSIEGNRYGHLNTTGKMYKDAMWALIGQKQAPSTESRVLVDGVHKYLEDLRQYLASMGLHVAKRENYFPTMYRSGEVATRTEEFITTLMKGEGWSRQQAMDMVQGVIRTNGVEISPGVGFGHQMRRSVGPKTTRTLHEQGFLEDDLATVLTSYTQHSIHRAIIDRRAGKKVVGDDGKEHTIQLAGWHERLQQQRDAGNLSQRDYDRVVDTILPAMFGTLGSDIDPRWRRFQAAAITYQNLRLLSMATLSSIPDLAGVLVRGDMRSTLAGLGKVLSKQGRQELYDLAELIGSVRDDYTAHALNDTTQDMWLGSKFRQWNEHFFRVTQMHRWTNFTRILALGAGRQFLVDSAYDAAAGKPKAKQALRELGVTHQEVLAWKAAKYPMPAQWGEKTYGQYADVYVALNQFIDESIIRPDASQRPAWASNPKLAVFWHLKSFLWGFHETILRRVWSQVKAESWPRKALPVITFAIPYLVLAAVGYELRRRITWMGEPPKEYEKEGGEYLYELLQRSGSLGLMQLAADMEEAEDRGRLSLLAVMGPTATQFEEWITKPFADNLTKAIPGAAQSPPLRAWIQNSLDDIGILDLEPGKKAWNDRVLR